MRTGQLFRSLRLLSFLLAPALVVLSFHIRHRVLVPGEIAVLQDRHRLITDIVRTGMDLEMRLPELRRDMRRAQRDIRRSREQLPGVVRLQPFMTELRSLIADGDVAVVAQASRHPYIWYEGLDVTVRLGCLDDETERRVRWHVSSLSNVHLRRLGPDDDGHLVEATLYGIGPYLPELTWPVERAARHSELCEPIPTRLWPLTGERVEALRTALATACWEMKRLQPILAENDELQWIRREHRRIRTIFGMCDGRPAPDAYRPIELPEPESTEPVFVEDEDLGTWESPAGPA